MEAIQVLQGCSVEGNVVRLPDGQLDRKLYEDVAKLLQGIGGKWKGGKVQGFVFDADPTERLAQIQGGEVINLKKEFQFFETPAPIARELVRDLDLHPGNSVLEPSAGRGALIDAVLDHAATFGVEGLEIFYAEKMIDNRRALAEKYHGRENVYALPLLNDDFLEMSVTPKFDRIIANPPFTKNQDIRHIMRMWDVLAPGGRIVTLSSRHWQVSGNGEEKAFRHFLGMVDATVLDIAEGTFKDSGTNVATVRIIIDKPALP